MTAHTFEISDAQWAKYEEWAEEQEVRSKAVYAFKKRKGHWTPDEDRWGGSYEWIFVPTGIATAVKVLNKITGEEIDLSDYDRW